MKRDYLIRAHAQRQVFLAKKEGRLVPQPCEICDATKLIEAHHQDYTKPLDVNWLCVSCHRTIHHACKEIVYIAKNYAGACCQQLLSLLKGFKNFYLPLLIGTL